MKILAISKVQDKEQIESAIDLWRVHRPLMELKKHVDWKIDFQPYLIRDYHGLDSDPDAFMRKYGEEVVDQLGEYDIIFTSYTTSPHIYTLLWGTQKKHGTKFIIDIDDDMYDIDPWNPAILRAGKAGIHFLQRVAQITENISCTTDVLATKLKNKSEVVPKVFVNQNYISDQYQHEPINNGENIIIGYFGGASHYRDIHNTHFLPALQRIMHENKNVYFECAGQPVDYYLPKSRVKVIEPVKGVQWPTELFPSLQFDIALLPLMDTVFSKSKSNIKWQESTRMGAAVIASNIGPYKSLPSGSALSVSNTEDQWYDAITQLLDKQTRQKQVATAQEALKSYRLEDNWQSYKSMFEEVHNDTSSNSSSR